MSGNCTQIDVRVISLHPVCSDKRSWTSPVRSVGSPNIKNKMLVKGVILKRRPARLMMLGEGARQLKCYMAPITSNVSTVQVEHVTRTYD